MTAPANVRARRKAWVSPIIAAQRQRWLSMPEEQRTPQLRAEVAARLHNNGSGLRAVEIADVFGCSDETVRHALKGWLTPTTQEREILKAIRAADQGTPDGAYAEIILKQARAAAEFTEESAAQRRNGARKA